MQHSLFLMLAIIADVAGTIGMKFSNGFTKPAISVVVVLLFVSSFYGLAAALKQMDVGIAYAIWAGAGTALIAVIGVLFFNESMDMVKALSIFAIVLGVVGINITTV